MNTHDIEPLKYGGPDSDDYVTGWNDCCARIAQERKRRGEPICYLWVNPETQKYEIDRCTHPLDDLIPVYRQPQSAESTFTTPDCPRCGCVQDGQCLCIPSSPSAEPVKVPSDDEIMSIAASHETHGDAWQDAEYRFTEADFLAAAHALLARYGWPAKEPSKDEIRAVLLKHGYTIKPGHDDLKPYVYAAARELIALAQGRSSRD